jgi:hypothetical protein
MAKPLDVARAVAARGLYKVAYTGATPRTYHRNLYRQRERHENAILAEED